jgi:hypothetical protein
MDLLKNIRSICSAKSKKRKYRSYEREKEDVVSKDLNTDQLEKREVGQGAKLDIVIVIPLAEVLVRYRMENIRTEASM